MQKALVGGALRNTVLQAQLSASACSNKKRKSGSAPRNVASSKNVKRDETKSLHDTMGCESRPARQSTVAAFHPSMVQTPAIE